MTFTPAELAATEEAFARHKQGRCPTDCSFCEDLFLSHDPRHHAEYKWIRTLRTKNLKQLPLPTTPKKAGKKQKTTAAKAKR